MFLGSNLTSGMGTKNVNHSIVTKIIKYYQNENYTKNIMKKHVGRIKYNKLHYYYLSHRV